MTKLATRGSTVKFLDLFNWSDSPWAALTQFRLAPTFRVEHYAEDGRFVVPISGLRSRRPARPELTGRPPPAALRVRRPVT
ncbi:MAG TPA: hypothetical protein VN695_16015 [Streptosporangiaceae bacterium]|nr:hypothetical protein [Streptosporangiaceae bacterium]